MSFKMGLFSPCGLIVFTILVSNLCMGEKYSIVHWGDVSGQLQKFHPGTVSDASPSPCKEEDPSCVGGLVNLVHYINNASFASPDVPEANRLKLSTGNLVGGENGWMSVLGWDKYSDLLDKFYQPTFMSLGLKEFGAGLARTNAYLANTTVPVILTNVKCSTSSGSAAEEEFCLRPKTMRQLNNIGILGFINPTVMKLSSPGNLEFEDITTSLKKVVDSYPNIKTFIAIGDGSLDISKSIIDKIPKVKLVIYGRWLGGNKDMTGQYPLKYGTGYIATAGEFGSKIGQLILDIDDQTGNIRSTAGSKLITTSGYFGNVEPKASESVNKLTMEIDNEKNITVGHTIFKLEGGKLCWRHECNLGNLVTDAMVHCALKNNYEVLPEKTPLLSLWHGGALFDDTVKPNMKISKMDIHKWLPYHNRAHVVRIEGSDLWKVFQASALGITANKTDVSDWGQFLQVSSGLEVYYDTRGSKPELKRIRILHEEDAAPVMKDIEMTMDYYFVIPSFIHEGRNVYGFARNFWKPLNNNFAFDDDCVEDYIKALEVLSIGFEERIWINDDGPSGHSCNSKGSSAGAITLTFFLTLIGTLVLSAVIVYFCVIPKLTGGHSNNFRLFSNA